MQISGQVKLIANYKLSQINYIGIWDVFTLNREQTTSVLKWKFHLHDYENQVIAVDVLYTPVLHTKHLTKYITANPTPFYAVSNLLASKPFKEFRGKYLLTVVYLISRHSAQFLLSCRLLNLTNSSVATVNPTSRNSYIHFTLEKFVFLKKVQLCRFQNYI